MRILQLNVLVVFLCFMSCKNAGDEKISQDEFPVEMVRFIPYEGNPVFQGTDTNTWDKKIRERGYILFEDDLYKMWYTGYRDNNEAKSLGYATSKDGINWTRYAENPIFNKKWTEDMIVIKADGKYYMYAEGENDIAHLLISDDGINWQEQGDLEIRNTKGEIIPGPYGTPTVWNEHGKWYLFYERNDEAIWLATSEDHKTWTNVQDDPVIKPGPEKYDAGAVAANQVVKYKGRYYIYYHASSQPMESSVEWTSNVAMSTDLIHWVKYPKNPIVAGDHSSPILVFDGKQYRLYTMHSKVEVYLPNKDARSE